MNETKADSTGTAKLFLAVVDDAEGFLISRRLPKTDFSFECGKLGVIRPITADDMEAYWITYY